MGKLIEGYWDCQYCGRKAILGRNRECPGCGKARDGKTKFYLREKKYASEKETAKINRNPDWICDYCGEQLNSDNDDYCKSCGAPRRSDSKTYFEYHQQSPGNNKKFDAHDTNQDENNQRNDAHDSIPYPPTSASKDVRLGAFRRFIKASWKPVLILVLAVSMLLGLIYLFIPKKKDVFVTGVSWEYTISIEKYKTVDENGWSLPNEARLKYTTQELSRYDSVLDHYETKTRQVQKQRISGYEEYVVGQRDLGNGYFEEITATRPIYETYYENEIYQEPVYINVPVYETMYYYEIDKWVHERNINTAGNDKFPFWGETNLSLDERESGRSEKYFIHGNESNGKELKLTTSYQEWLTVIPGTVIKALVDSFGNATLKN